MDSTNIKKYFETLVTDNQRPPRENRIGRFDFGDIIALSDPVKEAWDYYFIHVEQADWGSVGLYKLLVDDADIYAIHTTTDGDDGWIEIYDLQGENLGMGRINSTTIHWRDQSIRKEGGLPGMEEI